MQLKSWYQQITQGPHLAGFLLVFLILSGLLIFFLLVPQIPQWSSYHHFADQRKIAGIPNFFNVTSNFAFILVSITGFYALLRHAKPLSRNEICLFFLLFSGIFLSGIGSAFYHWSPNNDSLVWDRIPMTLVFMSLLSLTIMERIHRRLGFWLCIPLLVFGIFSVWYWHYTELKGLGDLRLYALAQLYTILIILLILFLFPGSYPPLSAYLWMLFFYGLAKVCEYFDLGFYQAFGISGHSLKHIFAAIALYWTVLMLRKRGLILCRSR